VSLTPWLCLGIEANAEGIYSTHPVSQSGNGIFHYQTGSPYSGARLVPASASLFIPVTDCPDAGKSGILAFEKRDT